MHRIPAYTAEGVRLRDYSLESIQRLLEQDRITVHKTPKGVILCACFRPVDERQNPIPGSNPLVKKLRNGTYYSSLKSEGSARIWQLHKLPNSADVEHMFGRPKTKWNRKYLSGQFSGPSSAA
jgi:hypothetical protein